jgi:hypothetical protein
MGATNPKKEDAVSYSQFACVGTGFSAIGLGATLQRWYGIGDIVFFEKYEKLGGTWFISQYPGILLKLPFLAPFVPVIWLTRQIYHRMTISSPLL